jgi:hypothetical protein
MMHYFAPLQMTKGSKTYSQFSKISSVFMMLALVWLTVSTPFVFASQQKNTVCHQMTDVNSNLPVNEEESNPFSNSTEEKAPSGFSASEEYIHNHHSSDYYLMAASQFHKLEDAGIYVAFHGEMLVPPPNKA